MLFLLSLAVIPLTLSAALRRRIEWVLPAFASALVAIAYPLSMLCLLGALPALCYAAAALCLVWMVAEVARGRGGALWAALKANAFTPGLLGFVLLGVVFFLRQRGHMVTGTDDIYYWALEAKGIYAQQGLVGRALHLAPRFATYTPGMQLFQWLGAEVAGSAGDGLLFGMLGLFYAVYLLPLASRITWRRIWLLPLYLVFVVALPTAFNRDAYALLRVDTALGVCLGYCLAVVWRLCSARKVSLLDGVALALGLFVLSLVKQVGVGWALLPLTLLLVLGRGRTLRTAKWMAIAAPLVALGSWQLFCSLNGLEGGHMTSLREKLAQVLQGTYMVPEGMARLPKSLWEAFTLAAEGNVGIPSPLVGVPMLGWLVALLLFPLLLLWVGRQTLRPMATVSLWLLSCVVLFLILFSLSYPLIFSGEVDAFIGGGGERLQYLLERYFSPCLLGVTVLLAALVADGQRLPRARAGALLAALAVLLTLTCNWRELTDALLFARYPQEVPVDIVAMQTENGWTDSLDDPLHAVVLYGVDPTPEKRERLQYALLPVKLVTFYGDIGDAYFRSILRSEAVTHILCMDDTNPTYALASPYVEGGLMETLVPYRVTWNGDVPVLTP